MRRIAGSSSPSTMRWVSSEKSSGSTSGSGDSGESGIGRIRSKGGEGAAAIAGVAVGGDGVGGGGVAALRHLKAPSMKNKAFSPDEDARGFIKGNRQWLNARVQNRRRHPNQSLDRQRKWFLPFRQGG